MRLGKNLCSHLRMFAFYLANGTLALSVLDGIEYREVFEEASTLEMVFNIFCNVLEIDEDGEVLNGDYAQMRAAQFIRFHFDRDYIVEPPFEDWETDLC